MALIDLWDSARETIKDKHIQQIISFAGTGKLLDGSATSSEFRSYLSYVPSDFLERYAMECLSTTFDQGGLALQDIVNQIGRRLSFDVIDGAYRGKKGQVGFDGIWKSSIGNEIKEIIVEVKTTDAYRIDLETLAKYRTELIEENRINKLNSSILIIVGRQDTGDLEAQIRGSRHAWDIRLISVDSLIELMKLKEKIDDSSVVRKICTILTPQEFTRVDEIIDLVFSTTEEVISNADEIQTTPELNEESGTNDSVISTQSNQDQAIIVAQCIDRISSYLNTNLVKISRTVYQSPDSHTTVSCAISKLYHRNNGMFYWFAFHPAQEEKLNSSNNAFTAFICGSSSALFLFPFNTFSPWTTKFSRTTTDKRYYWHINIKRDGARWVLIPKKGFPHIDISTYLL